MGAKHVMFTCARMDATPLIIGNKIIDNKVHKTAKYLLLKYIFSYHLEILLFG